MFCRVALLAVLGVIASSALAQQAQQPTPQEVMTALSDKVSSLQQELDRMYLAGAREKIAAAQSVADAEARMATLIEWLKAAQAEKKAK